MKTRMLVLLTLLQIACGNQVLAQLWVTVNGMSAQDVTSLAIRTKDTIFVGTYDDGVYMTTNNGTNWWLVLGQLQSVYQVFSLALDPSGNVYAGTYSQGLFRSTDDGHAWADVCNDAPGNNLPEDDVYAVAANSRGTIFASDYGSIYRSTDGCTTWYEVRSSIYGTGGLRSIACSGPDTVYTCGTSDWFYYSTNNGTNWTSVGSSTGLSYAPNVLAAMRGGNVFAGTLSHGVYRSTDGGAHWSAANKGITGTTVNTLAVGPSGTLYAGTTTGVFFSSDNGANWTSANSGLTHLDVLAIVLDAYNQIYAGSYVGGDGGALYRATTPLPIQLTSFAAAVANGVVTLRWNTASEIDNFGFAVQKSNNLSAPFETITGSFTPGHGTTLSPHSYSFADNAATPGTWYYRLEQKDLDGALHYTDPLAVDVRSAPTTFTLCQNFPNPFNPSTNIRYSIPDHQLATLRLFDLLGREVATLVNEVQVPGTHAVQFNGRSLASGVYILRLNAGKLSATRTITIMK